jgi:hypothetical protein
MFGMKQSEKLLESLHGNEKHGTLSEQQRKASHLGLGITRAACKGMMERSPSV